VEGYLLRCAAPLAAATGSRALLEEATALLERASIPDGGAWMLGYEAYLSLAQAWLGHDEPDRARAVLAPLLAVADREPWLPALAAALAADGRALTRLGQREQARAALDRAAGIAGEHGLPHVLRDVREVEGELR
jgi:tetratricopeptide (TPR) repeat protein